MRPGSRWLHRRDLQPHRHYGQPAGWQQLRPAGLAVLVTSLLAVGLHLGQAPAAVSATALITASGLTGRTSGPAAATVVAFAGFLAFVLLLAPPPPQHTTGMVRLALAILVGGTLVGHLTSHRQRPHDPPPHR